MHSPGWSDVCGMMAGPTTQASSAMGTVTEAQMARILIKEYCFGLAGASSWAGNDWVSVMSLSVARKAVSAHRPPGSIPSCQLRRTGDPPYACRAMRDALRRRTVFAWR